MDKFPFLAILNLEQFFMNLIIYGQFQTSKKNKKNEMANRGNLKAELNPLDKALSLCKEVHASVPLRFAEWSTKTRFA